MDISQIPAIDAHAHYGVYQRGDKTDLANEFMTGDAAEVLRRAQLANVEWSIVSPLSALLPRGQGNAFDGNQEAFRTVPQMTGLLQYVVIDPRDKRTYDQADAMLQTPYCVGIKVHPEEHCYPITEYGRNIFEFAAARHAVVLTHSGEQNSLPADFVPLANEFPEVKLILAHIGCGWDGDLMHQVRAIQHSHHGNMYADTSSASSILPHLIERAVREIGAERILFGTDTPLYFAPMQRSRIDHADLSSEQKRLILHENARSLFQIEGLDATLSKL